MISISAWSTDLNLKKNADPDLEMVTFSEWPIGPCNVKSAVEK